MNRKDKGYTGFWIAIVLVVMVLGFVVLVAVGCRASIDRDRQRTFCIKQGYADVQYVIDQNCCVGYRDGVLIVAPIAELDARKEK